MKINEKNLCTFATTPPVDLEGWLNKRGELNKSWQRRWFVLKGNLLFYFEKRGDKEPLGMIILEGCTVELAEEGEQYCFQIVFHGSNNRTYYLATESQSNMEQWMKALTCAGYDYMKLMVAELQRQLDEIEGQCKEKTPENTPLHVPPKAPPRRQNPFNKPLTTEYASNADASSSSNRTDNNTSNKTDNVFTTPVPLRRKAPTPPAHPAKEVHSSTASDTLQPLAKVAVPSANIVPPEPNSKAEALSQDETSRTPVDDEINSSNTHPTVSKSRRQVVKATKSSDAIASMTTADDGDGDASVASRSSDQVDGIGARRPMERGAVASFSFETMHSALGIPVLADLSKWNAGQIVDQRSQQEQL